MELGLAGRSVLITGSSKGIGLACAHGFAAEGCDLHLVARTATDLKRARDAIRARYPVQVATHALDLSDSANVDRLVEVAGDVDILVNNAGAIPGGSIETVDEMRWREGWDLKVYGYINMTRAFLARMTARGRGVIINDIGTGGEKLDYDYIAGAAGNASLMAFTRAIGGRSIHSGVRVVGVNPGPVETDRIQTVMRQKARSEFGDESRAPNYYAHWPMGRFAKPEEVADLIVFLASDRASYISGTVVTIDGGMVNNNSIL
jgi:NAD(P)-dependent dehydrogenase (short-subunit alcohol dehydrogenase family)